MFSKKLQALLVVLFFIVSSINAQVYTQAIKGKIIDKESKSPLFGVTVALYKDTIFVTGASTNDNGDFRIAGIHIGKYKVKVSYIGYLPFSANNIELTSAKETELNIELTESAVNVKEVEITATRKHEALNEMATVSARTFSVEEANRYAGSRGEPGRMASNYAGVNGSNDSRNDIIIRGNSPLGLVWRLEGIDIPNPNHFTVNGNTGGPVSILNNKSLSNSDFLTGAFPAEYGNGIAGIFDLRMRNGNNNKHEFSAQLGFLGTEIAGEGPLSKKSGASYLFTYRYSTLKLFEALKIPIGTDAVPKYQDMSFKLNFPLKKGFNISLWGVGGLSQIDILVSKYDKPIENIYGEDNADQYFGSGMGVTGISISKQHSTSAYSKLVISQSWYDSHTKHDFVYRDSATYKIDSIRPKIRGIFQDLKTYANYFYNKKYNNRHSIKAGVLYTYALHNYFDSTFNSTIGKFYNRIQYKGDNHLIQPFVQWKFKVNDNLSFSSGIHGQYFSLNKNSWAIEPRLGVKWNVGNKHSFSLGTGLHSQMQPMYSYVTLNDYKRTMNTKPYNDQLGFTKAMHYVLGYDFNMSAFTRIKVEAYYQNLWDIPVDKKISSYSMINQGASLSRNYPDTLVNGGVGFNKGIELTIEKFFSKSFFLLATGSLYDSKYKGSDGVLRNTDFNGTFAANLLAGKEFKIKDKNFFNTGFKITYAGGRRYTPADLTLSKVKGDLVEVDAQRNTLQFNEYFRLDCRFTYKINAKHTTHEIAFDLVNILNTKNVLGLTYAPDPKNPTASPLREEYQLGFLPLFYYKIDF